MASAKQPLFMTGAPMRRVVPVAADRDRGRLTPWLLAAAAALAFATASRDAGQAPVVLDRGAAATAPAGQGALIQHAATRAALADAVGGFR
jgi:hypothetical protein